MSAYPVIGTLSGLGSEHTVGAGAGALAWPARGRVRVVVARVACGERGTGEQHDERDDGAAGGGAHLGAVGGASVTQRFSREDLKGAG